MEKFKISQPIAVEYVALKRTLGLVDLTLKSYDPTDTLVDTIVMTEVANGVYRAAFTPAVLGFWRIEISSVVNKDFAAKEYDIVATDLTDVKAVVDATKTELDATKTELDATKTELDTVASDVTSIEGTVTSIQTEVLDVQTKITDVQTKVTDIQTTVNTIKADVESLEIPMGGYIL